MKLLTIIFVIAACLARSSNAQQGASPGSPLLHLLGQQPKNSIEKPGNEFKPKINPAVSELASCDNRECDQRCRRMGFTGGVCVNGVCKCDINFSTKKVALDYKNDIESVQTLASCNNRECDQRCRRMGFTGGVCVNGVCKCDINFSTKNVALDYENDIESVQTLASCNNRECDQRCRRMGFTGGVCVNGVCKCDINFSTKNVALDYENDIESVQTLASCNNRECDQRCRRMGFTGGVCVNGVCKCDINFSTKNVALDYENDIESVQTLASCNNRECDQRCRRMGFTGGICVNGVCKCDINFATKNTALDFENDIESVQTLASCNNRECDQRCRRMGFTGGVCVNGVCKCDINFSTKNVALDFENDIESVQTLASCNNRQCDQRCRRMGFTGGVCVNGVCKCDINFSTKNVALDYENAIESVKTPTISELASCNNRECDQRCRRIGFTGGVCVNGVCKCDINFSGSKTFYNIQEPQTNTKSQMNYFTSRQNCNNRVCNQRCRRLGFTGGVCVNGRCKCDNFLKFDPKH